MSVYPIKRKFQKGQLPSTLFEPTPPKRKKAIDVRQAVSILAMVCEAPPEGRARWTVRLVTSKVIKRGIVKKISREPIRRLLHEGQLKPWREKNVCIKELTPNFVAKMEDVLNLYERPLNPKEPVVCLDERPIVLHKEIRPPIEPEKAGYVLKRD
jgi:hypothetical protein